MSDMKHKPKLLWIGDAACQSGFGKVTAFVLEELRHVFEVVVLGLNYNGDPHPFPYPIYPAAVPGSDGFGIGRLKRILERTLPEIVVIQNDPWNLPEYMAKLDEWVAESRHTRPKLVVALAVDGKNCRGRLLNAFTNDKTGEVVIPGVDHAIFWTEFGAREAVAGGYKGTYTIIPLGVDTETFVPMDRQEARKFLMPKAYDEVADAFIVGNVNRNQPRKRMDLTIQYFAEWVHADMLPTNVMLFLHVSPTGDKGYNIIQLADYYNVRDRLILANDKPGNGPVDAVVAKTLSCFDVQISTTQGEGWGLTTLEGMACGVPQIVPDWSALGEWARLPGVRLVPCPTQITTANNINAVGGVPDKAAFVRELRTLYADRELRTRIGEQARESACASKFSWTRIGQAYIPVLTEVLAR